MKKLFSLLLALTMIFALAAVSAPGAAAAEPVKAGFIFLHDENSTYDLNFINAAKEACEKLGVEYLFKTGIPEGQECADAAEELIDEGCNFIFADSFGHEPFLIQVAKEYPEVQFCHATGTQAHTVGLANYHNGFASIYEGRFLGGVAAGLKLNDYRRPGQGRLHRRFPLCRSEVRLHLLLPRCPLCLPLRHHGSHLYQLLVRPHP